VPDMPDSGKDLQNIVAQLHQVVYLEGGFTSCCYLKCSARCCLSYIMQPLIFVLVF
jgi:hypothetical protein